MFLQRCNDPNIISDPKKQESLFEQSKEALSKANNTLQFTKNQTGMAVILMDIQIELAILCNNKKLLIRPYEFFVHQYEDQLKQIQCLEALHKIMRDMKHEITEDDVDRASLLTSKLKGIGTILYKRSSHPSDISLVENYLSKSNF